MKRLMTLTLMIALLLIPIGIAAQKNVVKAIDHFVSNKSYAQYITPSVSRENDSRTGNPIAYCYHYTFEIPRANRKPWLISAQPFMRICPKPILHSLKCPEIREVSRCGFLMVRD